MKRAPESGLLEKILWILALALVAAALIFGFQATGGPGYQRMVRHDDTRLTRIRTVSRAVVYYYHNHHNRLPVSLQALVDDNAQAVEPNLTRHDAQDPASKALFPYKILAKDRFELCANYETEKAPSQERPKFESPPVYINRHQYDIQGASTDDHPKGPKCYSLQIIAKNL